MGREPARGLGVPPAGGGLLTLKRSQDRTSDNFPGVEVGGWAWVRFRIGGPLVLSPFMLRIIPITYRRQTRATNITLGHTGGMPYENVAFRLSVEE